MSQTPLKNNVHSRSVQHIDYLTKLSQWLKQLPVEERYLQIRLANPVMVTWLRQIYFSIKDEESKAREEHEHGLRPPKSTLKVNHRLTQTFFDNLVVMSQDSFMDTIGFDFSLVDDVDRFIDLLSTLAFRAKIFTDYLEIPIRQADLPANSSRQQLAINLSHFILTTIRYRCEQRECGQPALQQQRLRKRQYRAFWTGLTLQGKEKFLLLGMKSSSELLDQLGLKLTLKQLDRELKDLIKLEKNQFCNRLLKSKFKRCNEPIRGYYRRLFDTINQRLEINKCQKKLTTRVLRRAKTDSFSSNQTNETDIQTLDRLTEKVLQLTRYKLQSDLEQFADILSDKANLHFKHREVSFNRIQHTLKPYGIELLLFGSCANGLALERSDVDIALSANVFNFFPFGTIKERTAFALEDIHKLLATKKWIASTKSIFTAAIPVLKLVQSIIIQEINTSVPMDEPYPPELREALEIDKDSQQNVIVQLDLTVDTRGLVQPENSHLGIRSTEMIGEWLAEIDGLYRVLIILKYILFKRGLSSTYKGGISPYCLLVMIKAYIRQAQLVEPLPTSLLEGFLRYYGVQFDQKMWGVDILGATSPFYKRQPSEYRLEVKDPLNGRVMTRNAYLYNKIKEQFMQLKERCIDSLKRRIRQNLMELRQEKLQDIMMMEPQKYFTIHSHLYPKNVFCEYDLT